MCCHLGLQWGITFIRATTTLKGKESACQRETEKHSTQFIV